MVNFELVTEMIEKISVGEISKGMSFNEFCIQFYLETKILPLSKFLNLRGYSNKMPKIMNTRKAGEVLFESKNRTEIKEYLKKIGFDEMPQLNYSAIMVLRKVPIEKNWQRLTAYLKGEGTIDFILKNNKRMLLPEEKSKINEYLQESLNISSNELIWLLDKYQKIVKDKMCLNSINKLV